MYSFYIIAGLSATVCFMAIAMAVFVAGISRLKKHAELLEKRNLDDREKFRIIFDGVNDALIIHNLDGRIIDANKKAADMFGVPLDELTRLSVTEDLFHNDRSSVRIHSIWEQVMTGEMAIFPWTATKAGSGESFEVEVSLRKIMLPDYVIIATIRDMTLTNMAETEIRKLAAVVEQVDESVVVCDKSSRIIYVNPFFEKITGYSSLEVLGEKTGILKSGIHDSAFYRDLWITISAGKNWHGILRNRKKDGTLFDEEATIFPIKNQKSEIAGYAAVKRDITQKLKDELALKNAKENAEKVNMELESAIAAANAMSEKAIEASKAKSEFIASVSHELRTPLNIILGSIELMTETRLDEEQEKFLNVCRNACESLLDIISGILDIAKIEAGQLHIESIPFEPWTIIEDIILLNGFRAESRGITLVSEISGDIPVHLIGDPARLRQILVNLVNNAIKFTEKGEIKVKATSVKDSFNHPGTVSVEFSVSDTGIGISTENIDRIFDEFIQADSSITRKFGGTGLGLTISKKLVNLMGGTIHAESSPGRGSRFFFTIRFMVAGSDQTEASCAEKESHNGPVPDKKFRILLAEDIPDNRMLISKMLASVADIEAVDNGIRAVEKFRCGNYDLVIMDIQMPEMDGYTAARIIRELETSESRKETPLVALTAFATSEELKKSMEAGFSFHVTKPVKKASLIEAVRTAIEKYSEPDRKKDVYLSGDSKTRLPDSADNTRGEIVYPVTVDADIEELIPFFLENRIHDLARLHSAIHEKDFGTIMALGHSLKGTGGSYGFHLISEKGGEIEDAASACNIRLLLDLHNQLADYLGKVQVRFE